MPPLPIKSMLKSASMWACLAAHFGHDWGIISITSDLPKYMKYILHYDIEAVSRMFKTSFNINKTLRNFI